MTFVIGRSQHCGRRCWEGETISERDRFNTQCVKRRDHRNQFWHRWQHRHLQGLQRYSTTRHDIMGCHCSQETSCGLGASEQGQWSSQSGGSSCTIIFPWCFITSTKLSGKAKIAVQTSNFIMRKYQTALRLQFNFKARTYKNAQYRSHIRPMDSSIPSYSKRRAWNKQCTNAGTIYLFGSGCIYTLTSKAILPPLLVDCEDIDISAALSSWRSLSNSEQPPQQSRSLQKAWDVKIASVVHASLLSRAEPLDQAHLPNTLEIGSKPLPSQSWDWDSPTIWSEYLLVHSLGLELVSSICVHVARR